MKKTNPNCKKKKQETCYWKNNKKMCFCKNPIPDIDLIRDTYRSLNYLSNKIEDFKILLSTLENQEFLQSSERQRIITTNRNLTNIMGKFAEVYSFFKEMFK